MQGDTKWGFSLQRNVSMGGLELEAQVELKHSICGLMAVYFKGFDYTKRRYRRWKCLGVVPNIVERVLYSLFST